MNKDKGNLNIFKNFRSKSFTAKGNIKNKTDMLIINSNNHPNEDLTDVYKNQISLTNKMDDLILNQTKLEHDRNSLASDISNLTNNSISLSCLMKKKNVKIKNKMENFKNSINIELEEIKCKLKQIEDMCENIEELIYLYKRIEDNYKSIENTNKYLINENTKKDKLISELGEKVKHLENENLKTNQSNLKRELNDKIISKQINEKGMLIKESSSKSYQKGKGNENVKSRNNVLDLVRKFESLKT